MTPKEEILKVYRKATVITRIKDDKMEYRIAIYPKAREKFLSNWCKTEERAWYAAICRYSNNIYKHDTW